MKSTKKITPVSIRSSAAEYLTYVSAVGGSEQSVEMRYEDGELSENSVVKKYLITADDGK